MGDDVLLMEQFNFSFPAVEEELLIKTVIDDIDLILIFPESTGSIDEFIVFSREHELAKKLRVFVKPRYHPLYFDKVSQLRDRILAFVSVYGHVYCFKDDEQLVEIIFKLLGSYRRVKILESFEDSD